MADADIDLYADDIDGDFNQDDDYNHDSNVDLYDDVITTPSDDHHNDGGRSSSAGGSSPHHSRHAGKRVAVYVGNLTWWTTDQDLIDAMKSLGVNDVVEIKFYENRANGQSKGFCVVALSSENSLKVLMEKLPKKELHGQNPAVTACTRQNLNYFESQSRKGGHGGGSRRDNSDDRRGKDRDRERSRDGRDNRQDNRSNQQNRSGRSNQNQGYQQQQRISPNTMHPPPQGPPPPQYQPGRTPWMSAPPPQIHQMPPPPTRHGAPQMAGAPPPPPGLQAPPPVRPGPPPPNNMRLPPPRAPMPPMGPRSIPPPDPRGPPPTNEWERHLAQPPPQHIPPQPVGPPSRPPPPVSAPGGGMPPSIPPPSAPVPSPHINPAFFHQQGVPPGLAPSSQATDMYSRPPPTQFSHNDYRSVNERGPESSAPSISESEFEEIMGRNRTVSSSAIARAVADASAGDYASAIETLVTAISLIKQSKVANDERCKILISSLQDTLHGIESKSYGSRSKERARSRERERSRERSSRREKSSRRDRSRSRDREYRDRSRERDRYHEDRYREKDRDHDRDRRSSRH